MSAIESIRERRKARTSQRADRWDAEGWPEECMESERRFGHRGARLYPLVSQKRHDGTRTNENAVRTPKGIGTLLQVIGGEARVLLLKTKPTGKDLGGKPFRPMSVFKIEDVTPYEGGSR